MKQVNGQGNISDALLACSITFPIQMVIAFAIEAVENSVEEKREQNQEPRCCQSSSAVSWSPQVFGLFYFPPIGLNQSYPSKKNCHSAYVQVPGQL